MCSIISFKCTLLIVPRLFLSLTHTVFAPPPLHSEWVNDIGDDGACKETNDAGAVDNWMVPLASSLLIGCWALASYLFNVGGKALKLEEA
jgi:hypothetical protein